MVGGGCGVVVLVGGGGGEEQEKNIIRQQKYRRSTREQGQNDRRGNTTKIRNRKNKHIKTQSNTFNLPAAIPNCAQGR